MIEKKINKLMLDMNNSLVDDVINTVVTAKNMNIINIDSKEFNKLLDMIRNSGHSNYMKVSKSFETAIKKCIEDEVGS